MTVHKGIMNTSGHHLGPITQSLSMGCSTVQHVKKLKVLYEGVKDPYNSERHMQWLILLTGRGKKALRSEAAERERSLIVGQVGARPVLIPTLLPSVS